MHSIFSKYFENFETNTVSEVCPYVTTYAIKIGFSAFKNRIRQNTEFLLPSNIHSLNYIH